jgi:hypothetical protein
LIEILKGPSATATEPQRSRDNTARICFAWGPPIGQVVHDYGDVCQAVTELALDLDAEITIDEFTP